MVGVQLNERPRGLEADLRYRLGLDRSEAEHLDGHVLLDGRHGHGERTAPRVGRQRHDGEQGHRGGDAPFELRALCHHIRDR